DTFFFQAEDGIRAFHVTGVQTCALPIFIGIPPAVAVGSEASQILASSFSGTIAHSRRGNVDFRMGIVLVAGGFVGAAFGVWLFEIGRASCRESVENTRLRAMNKTVLAAQ